MPIYTYSPYFKKSDETLPYIATFVLLFYSKSTNTLHKSSINRTVDTVNGWLRSNSFLITKTYMNTLCRFTIMFDHY